MGQIRFWGAISATLFAVSTLTGCSSDQDAPKKADTIFLGGKIVTVDDANPTAEALAVRDGRIVAVGSRDSVETWRGYGTKTVDLKGQTLMPGFVEPHTHAENAAWIYQWVDISGFTTPTSADVRRKLKAAVSEAEKAGNEEWVAAFGWDPILTPDLTEPTADELDEIAPDNPLIIMLQSMHTVYANHKAMEVSDITKDTPQPEDGGRIIKDPVTGEPTGRFEEIGAITLLLRGMPRPMEDDISKGVKDILNFYAYVGITTIGQAGVGPGMEGFMAVIKDAAHGPDARVRVRVYTAPQAAGAADGHVAPAGEHEGDALYAEIGTKLFYDGSPYTGSMLLYENYLNNDLMQNKLGVPKDSHGESNYKSVSAFEADLREQMAGGRHTMETHGQGDRAVNEIMNAYETVLNESAINDHRWRIEHLALVLENDIQRAFGLGVTLSFHINHVYYYGQALRDQIIGPERAERLMPISWAKKHGIRFSVHADTPMYPPYPLLTMRSAVTRLDSEGAVIGADKAITVEDAIRAVTINAAWQLFMEDDIGSLEVGKFADLVILAQNPFEVEPEFLHEIKVVKTYLAGREVKDVTCDYGVCP